MISLLEKYDFKIIRYINSHLSNRILDKLMKWITALGNLGLIWIVISIFLISKKDLRQEGLMVIAALILTAIVGECIIKHIVKRKRPFVIIGSEDDLLIGTPRTYSFPSGHTASSFAVSSVFINTDNNITVFIVIIATLIALSRLYLNVHYPSDIIGGGILGFLCGSIIVFLFTFLAR